MRPAGSASSFLPFLQAASALGVCFGGQSWEAGVCPWAPPAQSRPRPCNTAWGRQPLLLATASPLPTGARVPEGPSMWPQPVGPSGPLPQATVTWVALLVLPPAGTSDLCPPSPYHGRSQDLPGSSRSPGPVPPWGTEQEHCITPSLTLSPRALLCPFLLPSPSVLVLG